MCGSGTLAIEAALIAADIAPGLSCATVRLPALEAARPGCLGRGARRGRGAAPARAADAGPHPRLRSRPGRDPRRRGERRARGPRQAALLPALRAREAPGGAGADGSRRREPAVRRASRRGDELRALYALLGERCARATAAGRRPCSPAIPRSAANSASSPAHAQDVERADRVPAAAARDRAARIRAGTRAGTAAGHRCRSGARAARARRCSPTGSRRTSTGLPPGRSARRSRAIASTMPTCPSTPSRSISTTDRPGSAGRWLYVQEYAPPATVDSDRARARREEAISVLPEVTGLADATRSLAHAPAAEGQGAVRGDRRGGRARRRGGGRTRVPGELHRLPRHRPVPRPPPDARAHPQARARASASSTCSATRARRRCTRPRAARHRRRASTCRAPMSTGRGATSRSTASRGAHPFVQEDCLAWLAEATRRTLRLHLPRPADVLELEAHGPRVRRAARPRRT